MTSAKAASKSNFLDEVELCIPALRRYARALTRNVDQADDLVQDCLERAIRKKGLWQPTGPLQAWLFRILLNIFRNDRRRQKYTTHDAIENMLVEPSTPAPQNDRLALNEVYRAMDQLPDEQREALLLVVLEGTSYADAAKILDIPTGTLMSRLSRARAGLKRLTQDEKEPKLRAVT